MSRWIKNVISLSRTDVSLFKGHSTRSASTSRARLSGAGIQEILGEANGLVSPLSKKSIKNL